MAEKFYPLGKTQFETTALPLCMSFRVDAGAQAVGTDTIVSFEKGSTILGFRARVTEAGTSAGAATLQIGFTGTTMLSAATALTSFDAIGDIIGPDNSADAAVYVLTAADTFDFIVGTAALTAGKFDVDIFYYPARSGDLGTAFKEYTTE